MRIVRAVLFGDILPKKWTGGPFARAVIAQLLIINMGVFGYGAIHGADARETGDLTHSEHMVKFDEMADGEVAEVDQNRGIVVPMLKASFSVAKAGSSFGYRYPDPALLLANNFGAIAISIMFAVVIDLLMAIRREAVA